MMYMKPIFLNLKVSSWFIVFVFLCSKITYAQKPNNNPLNKNTIGLNFEDCTPPTIKVLDKNGMEVDYVNVSKMDIPSWVEVSSIDINSTVLANNFYDLDNDRFKIGIQLSSNSGEPTIFASLKSYLPGVDPNSENFLDHIPNFPLIFNVNEQIFESSNLLLMMDIDNFDDDISDFQPTAGYDESIFDGNDDEADDKTIAGKIGGILKVEYETASGEMATYLIDICQNEPIEIREVKLNLVSIKDANDVPFIPKSLILERLNIAQKIWKQACIRFVDKLGQALDESDIEEKTLADNSFLLDSDKLLGADLIFDQFGFPMALMASEDEKMLLEQVKDQDPLTIDIIFINEIGGYSAGFMPRAEAFYDRVTISPYTDPALNRSIFIATNWGVLTLPHEIGHVLTNDGHFGYGSGEYTAPYQYEQGSVQANGVKSRNLMVRGTASDLEIYSSKRLSEYQIEQSRSQTNLLIIPN